MIPSVPVAGGQAAFVCRIGVPIQKSEPVMTMLAQPRRSDSAAAARRLLRQARGIMTAPLALCDIASCCSSWLPVEACTHAKQGEHMMWLLTGNCLRSNRDSDGIIYPLDTYVGERQLPSLYGCIRCTSHRRIADDSASGGNASQLVVWHAHEQTPSDQALGN